MSSSVPTISVVTPCYNSEKYIRQTIESVFAQTFPALEIIVVDDGSTDRSADVVRSFGSKVTLIQQPNQGESIARNVGVQAARGSHVAFLDSDDLLEPTSYERLAAQARLAPSNVIYMGSSWFDDDPTKSYLITHACHSTFFPGIISENLAPVHCWLAPRAKVLEVGGFAGAIQYFEDWDMWWRIALTGAALTPVDFPGALYRHHPTSQMATVPMTKRSLGHAVLKDRMARAFLQREDLLNEHGETLFWACWSAINQARQAGVPWRDLAPTSASLVEIARRGPESVRKIRFAALVRLLGVRWANTLRNLLSRNEAPRPSAPAQS